MKPLLLLFMGFALAGGAAVYTDASDANHVTFLNSSGESIEQLTQKANAYCAQYGKPPLLKRKTLHWLLYLIATQSDNKELLIQLSPIDRSIPHAL